MNIRLFYITSTGSEWLEQFYSVTLDNYQTVIDRYVTEKGPIAERLEKRWDDGEYLALDVDRADIGPIPKEHSDLLKKVFNYVYSYN